MYRERYICIHICIYCRRGGQPDTGTGGRRSPSAGGTSRRPE